MIGPTIPAHILEKRKRKAEEEEEAASFAPVPAPIGPSRPQVGPSRPPTVGPSRPQVGPSRSPTIGPSTLPSTSPKRSPTPDAEPPQKRRVVGPAPPPAPLSEIPPNPPTPEPKPSSYDSDSSSDDDLGPRLPTTKLSAEEEEAAAQRRLARFADPTHNSNTSTSDGKSKRAEWMIVPPKSEDWAAKADPTKIKARKFNTGKGAKAPTAGTGGGISAIWTETPEEKRKRLEDEVMGRKKPATQQGGEEKRRDPEAEAVERRIREFNEKNRGSTLIAEHKAKSQFKEDDPSKRAFDREKDIAGIKISGKQKKEMLERAADFGSRFSSGSYL